jgi:1,2-diacylglycerol 3-alpha-glucosyltransferase
MHIVILFVNIGFYHAVRLSAAAAECKKNNWRLTAVQLTSNTLEHPWGDAKKELKLPVITLLSNENIATGADGLPPISSKILNKALKELNPDVVFLPGWGFQLSTKTLRWCVANRRAVVVMGDSKYDDEKRKWWKEYAKSWMYVRKFDAALVAGEAHADYIAKLGMPINRIFKGYDAVDNEHFSKAAGEARENEIMIRHRYPMMPNRPYFIAAFRLLPRKNAINLLAAYEEYLRIKKSDAWDLVICGNGEQKEELLAIIKERRLLHKIHLVGFLHYNEVGHWYGLAQALVHPALKEQWGLVINEACAAGLPILSSKTVGATEGLVRDNINGYLFDPEDLNDISSALIKVHSIGNEARLQMGNESRKLVEQFSPLEFGRSFVKATLMSIKAR